MENVYIGIGGSSGLFDESVDKAVELELIHSVDNCINKLEQKSVCSLFL